jgi:hypothetical protein
MYYIYYKTTHHHHVLTAIYRIDLNPTGRVCPYVVKLDSRHSNVLYIIQDTAHSDTRCLIHTSQSTLLHVHTHVHSI